LLASILLFCFIGIGVGYVFLNLKKAVLCDMFSYKFRLYPSRQQEALLLMHFDLCRFTYNKLLEKLNSLKKIDRSVVQHSIVELKEEFPELEAVYSKTLQYECYRLFSNLRSLAQLKLNGHKVGGLRFKGRDWFKTIQYNQSGFKFEQKTTRYGKLNLSKIGSIDIRSHRITRGKIKQVTLKKGAGKWFAILTTDAKYQKQKGFGEIGLDVGVLNFAADSNGNVIGSPLFLKQSLGKIKQAHNGLSRKKKGSRRRWKAKQRLTRLYDKVNNQRCDFLHKLTTKIIKENKVICIEDLNIRELIEKSRWNVRNFLDCSWAIFARMLECKAESAGARCIRVNPRNTSKKCSNCGIVHKMPLNKRFYVCECGLKIDRDVNAAKNILAQGLSFAKSL